MAEREYDAVVVGAGPNGLAAAAAIARAGLSVLVLEANGIIGGGARTLELTQSGFLHDVCSAIHPTAVVSPFFRSLPLADHGLEWVHPPICVGHPLDDGTAVVLTQSLERTCESFGSERDARTYRRLMGPLVANATSLYQEILGPIQLIPRSPLLMARFGLSAIRSALALGSRFEGQRARALLAGCAAHSFLPLDRAFTASFGIVLQLAAHVVGWPCARGGSQSIVNALASYIRSRGGSIETSRTVLGLAELPRARAYLFDLAPRHLATICGDELPAWYREKLYRYRHGPGIFKIDYALSGAIPWRASECALAGTVHLGGTIEEIASSEAATARGRIAERPYVLVAQQSDFDVTRAPVGKRTGWVYAHVPSGSTVDMTEAIEAQIERFAPGFRDLVIARSTRTSREMEAYNANYIGGDIAGGSTEPSQLIFRPVWSRDPYATPNRAIYLCSSSTPPGAGVHGMCGYHAAKSALRRVFDKDIDAPVSRS